jgi:hypothetical protein
VARRLPSPRWQTPLPEGVAGSWGPDVEAYALRTLGLRLDRHQRRALNRALVYGADGRLLHSLYLYSTGRQNGKTVTVRSLIGWALTAARLPAWERILGIAYDKKQARIPYRAVATDLAPLARRYGPAARGGLNITTYLGIRSGMYGLPRSYDIGTREARNALRGDSLDLAPFDEVRTQIDMETWAALGPTMLARPEPLAFATSTAGNDRSVLLREWFERGLRIINGDELPGAFGMTWYAASEQYPPDDPRSWREANPALAEGRLSEAALREAAANFGGFDTAAFRSEHLNLWADAVDAWLPAGVWARQTVQEPPERRRVVFGVEAVPSWRRATVTVAWPTDDGAFVGIAGDDDAMRPRSDGTAAASIAPSDLIELLDRLRPDWQPAAVACSGASAAWPHVEAWAERHDVPIVKLGSRELRSASQLFRSELIGGRLVHSQDELLSRQVRDARPSAAIEGADWYLSIRESAGEVDAIRAAAWAAWSAIAPTEAGIPPQIFL